MLSCGTLLDCLLSIIHSVSLSNICSGVSLFVHVLGKANIHVVLTIFLIMFYSGVLKRLTVFFLYTTTAWFMYVPITFKSIVRGVVLVYVISDLLHQHVFLSFTF